MLGSLSFFRFIDVGFVKTLYKALLFLFVYYCRACEIFDRVLFSYFLNICNIFSVFLFFLARQLLKWRH